MNGVNYLLNIPTKKIKYGLTRTQKLLSICENPHKTFKSIQVVGTNGKGSVSSFIYKIIHEANYKVGLYTSPHLVQVNERIRVNSQLISNNAINKFIKKYNNQIKTIQPSFFELLTVIAVWYFSKKNVDIAILETGLGGRLDSVTACDNQYIVFTPISMDHREILGRNIKLIAKEKAGAILNSEQYCLSSSQQKDVKNVLNEQASIKKNKINFLSTRNKNINKIMPSLLGQHQRQNALLSKKTIQELQKDNILSIDERNINKSIAKTWWPARFQIIQTTPTTIIFDVCHNEEGVKAFKATFEIQFKSTQFKYLVCGFEHNKDIKKSILKLEKLFDQIICTETSVRQSMPIKQLSSYFPNTPKIKTYKKTNDALNYVFNTAKTGSVIAIIGSHFFAPYINKYFKNCFAEHK